jgi:hypothetical protein
VGCGRRQVAASLVSLTIGANLGELTSLEEIVTLMVEQVQARPPRRASSARCAAV